MASRLSTRLAEPSGLRITVFTIRLRPPKGRLSNGAGEQDPLDSSSHYGRPEVALEPVPSSVASSLLPDHRARLQSSTSSGRFNASASRWFGSS
jgi:hypothetical protein